MPLALVSNNVLDYIRRGYLPLTKKKEILWILPQVADIFDLSGVSLVIRDGRGQIYYLIT